jgi:hypothetical protein
VKEDDGGRVDRTGFPHEQIHVGDAICARDEYADRRRR